MNVSVAPARPAQTIGLQFVEQYYSILHSKPRVLHRFYTDASTLTHGDFVKPFEAVTDTVTSQEGIQRKIDSLAFEEATTQVYSVDSQYSLGGAVIVQVTGALSCKGKPKRSFVQTFFLAPQEKGFFVLNDVFRYLPEPQALSYVPLENGVVAGSPAPANGIKKPVVATVDPQIVPNAIQPKMPVGPPQLGAPVIETVVMPAAAPVLPEVPVDEDVHEEEEEAEEDEEEEVPPPVEEEPEAPEQQLAPEPEAPQPAVPAVPLTYAERVKMSTQQKAAAAAAAAAPPAKPAAPALPAGNGHAATGVPSEAAENGPAGDGMPPPAEEPISSSVLVKELPADVTVEKLEEAFKGFGQVRLNGIAIKEVKGKPSYAFVDFETVAAAQAALEAQVEIDGQSVNVVEKKAQYIRTGPRGRGPGRGPYSGRGRVPGRGRGPPPPNV